jgi:hypothetical protein
MILETEELFWHSRIGVGYTACIPPGNMTINQEKVIMLYIIELICQKGNISFGHGLANFILDSWQICRSC